MVRDPELRRTGSGIAVASFTLAVDRDFADKQSGEKETDFIDVVAWRQTGEFVSKYFTKGRMAVVSGRLQMRKWTDKDGNKVSLSDFLGKKVVVYFYPLFKGHILVVGIVAVHTKKYGVSPYFLNNPLR